MFWRDAHERKLGGRMQTAGEWTVALGNDWCEAAAALIFLKVGAAVITKNGPGSTKCWRHVPRIFGRLIGGPMPAKQPPYREDARGKIRKGIALAACSLLLAAGCDRLKLPNKPPLPETSASAPQASTKAPGGFSGPR
jgi:hypothetical protein